LSPRHGPNVQFKTVDLATGKVVAMNEADVFTSQYHYDGVFWCWLRYGLSFPGDLPPESMLMRFASHDIEVIRKSFGSDSLEIVV
jgi:hypothetical protein